MLQHPQEKGKTSGGIASLYLTPANNIASIRCSPTSISSITLKDAGYMASFNLKEGESFYCLDTLRQFDQILYGHRVVFSIERATGYIPGSAALSRKDDAGWLAIIRENTGLWRLIGYCSYFKSRYPLKIENIEMNSGKDFLDDNLLKVFLSCRNTSLPLTIDPECINQIIV